MNFKYTLTLFLLFSINSLFAQDRYYRYWVELKDKDSVFDVQHPQQFLSIKSIQRREKYHISIVENDLPVSSKYVSIISSKGFRIIHKSKWLNAIAIQTVKPNLIDSIKNLPFVINVKNLGELKFTDEENKTEHAVDINEALSVLESKFDDTKNKETDSNFYGKSYTQVSMIKVDQLHNLGYMGQGVTIAVLDAGFKDAKKMDVFKYSFDSSHVLGSKDFVDRVNNVFDDDDHGDGVWSCMGAYKPYQLVGSSPKANFWLFRTEYAKTESPIEETHWLAASEFADSVGVDIISSSLGYNNFDDKNLNYQYKDLDGKTTIISRAASIAASKGILVVNSAGNEGDNDWKYLVAPADAKNILTVGGIDDKNIYSSFSSIGPSADKRIKPDVVALGENVWVPSTSGTYYQTNGTSFSCPIITGVAACLLQANIVRKNNEIIAALQLSSSQYFAPDKYLGYGIPDAVLANKILGGDKDFQLSKDIILDARMLKDNKIHLTIYSSSKQKINVVLENALDLKSQPLLKTVIDCKQGVTRVSFTQSQKIKTGTYAVYIHSKDGVNSYVFNSK